ncbi:MAG: peptidase S41, partial [Bacteroides sp.]
VSREFATAGITELILDLRYNKGGSLACAQLLCALVAPQSALGTPLGNLTYNDKLTSKDRSLTFDSKLIGSGSNLNISQGFIISSNATAGVSGVMLNLLSPLKRWGLVGSNVSCNGVATEGFADPTNTWSLNPVVCTVYNSLQESGRGGSFTATKTISETNNLTKFLPFGNPDEMLLSTTIGLIDGTIKPTSPTAQSTIQPVKEVIRTPARKSITRTTIR